MTSGSAELHVQPMPLFTVRLSTERGYENHAVTWFGNTLQKQVPLIVPKRLVSVACEQHIVDLTKRQARTNERRQVAAVFVIDLQLLCVARGGAFHALNVLPLYACNLTAMLLSVAPRRSGEHTTQPLATLITESTLE